MIFYKFIIKKIYTILWEIIWIIINNLTTLIIKKRLQIFVSE